MNLLDQIFEAGVVGCGGAGFPTHAKLKARVDYLLLNGAECEPLLRTDRYLMCHKADEMITAICAVKEQVEAEHCVIALKASYTKEISALEAAIARQHAPVTLHKMESFYPAGDEQVIVCEVTGRVVPPAGIPLDVGCVVSNVATMVAVYDAMQGIPFTHKYLTVTGAVKNPTIMRVPVGTPINDCIALAGGADCTRYIILSGGPMMGKPITMEEAENETVTKTTSGLILLPEEGYAAVQHQIPLTHMLNRARSACIQCSFCTQLCPRNLLGHPLEPHKIMRKLAMAGSLEQILEDEDIRGAQLCCECGICELYACPMQLQPRRVNSLIKAKLAEQSVRYPKDTGTYIPHPNRNDRKIPTQRAAVRAGVGQWYHTEPKGFLEATPTTVSIPLRQHIGAPAQPVVQVGDRVTVGQLIAACPEGKLGAQLHAPIDGRVVAVNNKIEIKGGQQ
ncbi:MAG: 4Fe-4S dicluster domain-containing protein [Angelakisella sp.]